VLTLRPYQETFIERIRAALADHARVVGVLPTGGGKTVVAAFITQGLHARNRRGIFLVHRQELLKQTCAAFELAGVPYGVIAPGYPMTPHEIQVGMVATVARRLERIPPPDMLVPDEAHHAVAGTWKQIFEAWPHARVLGLTATPERLDGRGLGDIFGGIAFGPTTAELIEGGYLARFDYYAPAVAMDLSGVRNLGGDFERGALSDRMNKRKITGDVVDHYRRFLGGAPSIGFCVSVKHAEDVAEEFRAQGFRSTSIDGTMHERDRAGRIAALATGEIQVLTSCDLISEGLDVPQCYGAILLRPTQSVGLSLQQVGRVLRLKPNGGRATVLDHVGQVDRHGLPDTPRTWSLDGKPRKKKDAAADGPSISTCKTCYAVRYAPATPCGQEACPYLQTDGRPPPDKQAGQLSAIQRTLEWAPGIDPVLADGARFKRLLSLAGEDEVKLSEIARLRGYQSGWVKHRIETLRQARAKWGRQA
jgi:superfamily II DNA or RNA helicase